MSNLTNKVISSNFQRLLQISESAAIADGTGSAFALRMSGSSNIGINTDPQPGIDLAVAGTISASIISASTGVFGANTVIIGGVQMSENSSGGITFQDSSSTELGAFQGDGYFILSSSLESGGSGRPLFSLARQVGNTQNNNVMQVDLTSMKFLSGNAGQHAQWKFGGQPSGSGRQGDFYINDNFTINPNPNTHAVKYPSLYITGSNKNIGMHMFPRTGNRLSVGGSLFTSGSDVGHITASGNLLVEAGDNGTSVFNGKVLFNYPSGSVWLNSISSSLIPAETLKYNIGTTAKRWNNLNVETIGLETPAELVRVGSLKLEDDKISNIGNDGYINLATVGTTKVGIGTSTPSSKLTVQGDISASGVVYADSFQATSGSTNTIDFNDDVVVTGDIRVSGNISSSGDIYVAPTKNLYLNGSENTYIDSDATDRIRFVAGGQQMFVLDYDTGNRAVFGDTKVGIGSGMGDNFNPSTELHIGGNLWVSESGHPSGHITASGNISSSGTIVGSKWDGDLTVEGDISASGAIHTLSYITSSGGILVDEADIVIANNNDSKLSFRRTSGIAQEMLYISTRGTISASRGILTSAVTASYIAGDPIITATSLTTTGNISSSGTITANQYSGNISGSSTSTGSFGHLKAVGKVDFTDLPTRKHSARVGGLYTISGSQFMATGSNGSHERAMYNDYSSSKFVLIREE